MLLKNAFCIKRAQRIQLAVENCVLLQFELKWSFFLAKKYGLHQMCSKNTTRCWKVCLTSFYVKNYLFPNFKDVLLKNAFSMKSPQRIQLAVENCVLVYFVLKTTFAKL